MTTTTAELYLHPALARRPNDVLRVEKALGRLTVIDGARLRLVTVNEAHRRHRRAGCVGLMPLPPDAA